MNKQQAAIIVDTIGIDGILDQCIEECGELIQVLAKRNRIRKGVNPTPVTDGDNLKSLIEEAADVKVCLGVLEVITGDTTNIEQFKEERWLKRIMDLKKVQS